MRTDEPVIQLRSVTKSFRSHRDRELTLKSLVLRGFRNNQKERAFLAIDSVDLDVHRGETIALIGHNGSGKSTLLKCIAGIYIPDAGNVRIDGRVSSVLELGSGFHPDLTGTENVFLNGALLGIPRNQLKREIDRIVEFSGLGEFMDQPIRTFSSGMYMRLGFSVAACVDAEVLLVDEVLAVGDEAFQRRCLERMGDLREQGRTIVIVSHGLAPLKLMCDRAAWLEHGRLLAVGNPGDIIDRYVETVMLAGREPGDASPSLEAGLSDAPAQNDAYVGYSGTGGNDKRADVLPEVEVLGAEGADPPGSSSAPLLPPLDRDGSASAAAAAERVFVFTGAGLISAAGEVVHQIRTGDPITVRLRYQNRTALPGTIIGVWFTRVDGVVIASATNTLRGLEVAGTEGAHELDVSFPVVPFLPGSFFLGVASTDARGERVYAHHARAARFDVAPRSDSEMIGLVAIAADWGKPSTVPFTSAGVDAND